MAQDTQTDIRCRFDFVCPKRWDDLKARDRANERWCDHCESVVFHVRTSREFDDYAARGDCVALAPPIDQEIAGTRDGELQDLLAQMQPTVLGMPTPPPRRWPWVLGIAVIAIAVGIGVVLVSG